MWKLPLDRINSSQPLVDGDGKIYLWDGDNKILVISPNGEIIAGADEGNPAFASLTTYWNFGQASQQDRSYGIAVTPSGHFLRGAVDSIEAFRP